MHSERRDPWTSWKLEIELKHNSYSYFDGELMQARAR